MKKVLDKEIFESFASEITLELETAQALLGSYKDYESQDLLNKVFRVFHSIKGASGFLGTESVTELAHKSENLMAKIRDAKSCLNDNLSQLLLRVCERLSSMFSEMSQTGEESLIPVGDLVALLLKATQQDFDKDLSLDQKLEKRENQSTSQVQSIRVQLGEVENLLKLSSELTLLKNKLVARVPHWNEDHILTTSVRNLVSVTAQIQQLVMKFRLQKVDQLFKSLPKIVNDLSDKVNKRVELKLMGESAELDKAVVEALKEPLIHLIRNSLDHGIEKSEVRKQKGKSEVGHLKLEAYNTAGWFILEIIDDGSGIDADKVKNKALEKGLISSDQFHQMSEDQALNLIFQAGFSTAETVSDLSGRGVGMDVVRSTIERWGGRIEVKTKLGQETSFKLFIPLTLAVVPSLVVESGGIKFAIPRSDIRYVFNKSEANQGQFLKQQADGYYFEVQDGKHVPAILLKDIFQFSNEGQPSEAIWLSHQNTDCVIVADKIIDFEDLVIKPINSSFLDKPMYSGASVLADGKIVYGLNPAALFEHSGVGVASSSLNLESSKKQNFKLDSQFLTFCSGPQTCWGLALDCIVSIHKNDSGAVEKVDNAFYYNFRGQLIPALPLQLILGADCIEENLRSIIVIRNKESVCAILVDQILDTHYLQGHVQPVLGRPELSGVAKFDSQVTHILNTQFLFSKLEVSHSYQERAA